MARPPSVDTLVSQVLGRDTCTGCGLCAALDPGLHMELNDEGYVRPVRRGARRSLARSDIRAFRDACPGLQVRAQDASGLEHHPTMGSYVAIWRAYATDPEVRHRGSSGGALTALNEWLLATGRATSILAAGAAAADPRRTVPVRITSRDEALRAAGSRYAPVGVLEDLGDPTASLAIDAISAKPCEVAALKAFQDARPEAPEPPLLLSFFCAGTPSQSATTELISSLGVNAEEVPDSLWYRGRGWPGSFSWKTGRTEVTADYDLSWGKHLGPTVQWRCKICPDGVGESADIVAADLWEANDQGYPIFEDGDGYSALIARTTRGASVVRAAHAAGVINLAPALMTDLASVQPLQVSRRSSLAARLIGCVLAGRGIPRYSGFRLLRLTVRKPRQGVRTALASFRRVQRMKTHRKNPTV